MDIIETNELLKKQLEAAKKTALTVRDNLKATNPMDVVYLNLALDAVAQRIRFHKKIRADKPAKKSKVETPASE